MDKPRAVVIDRVETLARRLLASGLDVRRVYLYGSRLDADPPPGADIDVAVISPEFGHNYMEEATRLLRIAGEIDLDFDAKPYSLAELQGVVPGTFLHDEVITKGILVFCRDEPPAE